MATITVRNTTVGVIHAGGKLIVPGQSAEVEEGAAGVARLIGRGKLEKAASAGGDVDTDKAALLARAKELGIDAKGTWGVSKLQEAIAEAEKAASAGGEGS